MVILPSRHKGLLSPIYIARIVSLVLVDKPCPNIRLTNIARPNTCARLVNFKRWLATVSRICFSVLQHGDYPSKLTSIPPYPINNERTRICSRQTYQHNDVHSLRSHCKLPYMECAMDQRDILSHLHVHMARFSHRVFGILQ